MSNLKTIEYDTKYGYALSRIVFRQLAPEYFKLKKTEYTMFDYLEDCYTVGELVDKQTPKKPIKEASSNGSVFYCPTCKNECSNEFNYCPNCGQVLKRIEKDYDKNK